MEKKGPEGRMHTYLVSGGQVTSRTQPPARGNYVSTLQRQGKVRPGEHILLHLTEATRPCASSRLCKSARESDTKTCSPCRGQEEPGQGNAYNIDEKEDGFGPNLNQEYSLRRAWQGAL
eukprot:1134734-Pelagomonas_calceolata.AAC.2